MTAGRYSIGSDTWAGASKLIEELGELQQVLGKLIGSNGDPNHWDGSHLIERLEEEIGDVTAAVAFFVGVNHLSTSEIDARTAKKLGLFLQWHEEQR